MSDTPYVYSLSTDFTDGVNSTRLEDEIRASDIVTALRGISTAGDDVVITFKAAIDSSAQSILDGIVSAHDGSPDLPVPTPVDISSISADPTGASKLAVNVFPAEGSRTNFISHQWNDPTTWYQSSVRVVDEQPTPLDSVGKAYQLANTDIIDTVHGKLFMEDYLVDSDGHSYLVKVKVDGQEKEMVDIDTGNGEWELDYHTGRLTMITNVPSGSLLEVTYHYATDSKFLIRPKPGKVLRIKSAEVQFSRNISMRDTVQFEFSGWAAAVDPEGFSNGDYGPDPQTLITVSNPVRYKSMGDFLSESNGVYPLVPRSSNDSPSPYRDLRSDVVTFPWNYQASIPLYSSAGMQIVISLVDDRPFSGEFSTATFYCYSEDDPFA